MSDVDELFEVAGGMSDQDLMDELVKLEGRADFLRAALLYRQHRTRPAERMSNRVPPRQPESDRRPPQNRRKAVVALMAEQPDRTWHYRDFRAEMIRREWLEADQRADHALGVAMGKMVKDGLLERPERGYYRLAPKDQAVLADDGGAEP